MATRKTNKKKNRYELPYYMICGIGNKDSIFATFIYGQSCRIGDRKYNPVFGVITQDGMYDGLHDFITEHVEDKKFFVESTITTAFVRTNAMSFFIDIWQPILVRNLSVDAIVDYAMSVMPPTIDSSEGQKSYRISTGIVPYRYAAIRKYLKTNIPDNTVRIYMQPDKIGMFGHYHGDDRITTFGHFLNEEDMYLALRMEAEKNMGHYSKEGWELSAHTVKDGDEADEVIVEKVVYGAPWGVDWANTWIHHQPISTTKETGRA